MPAFHTWGPSAQNARLPPTPPEYQTAYPTPTSTISDQSFYSSHNYPTRHGQSGRDFIDRYSQAPAYAAQQILNTQAPSRMPQHSSTRDFRQIPSYVPQIPAQYQYGPVAAPILPPIRAQESFDVVASQYSHAHPEPKQKEEKPTGGVAAHLDYDMDLMSSFVAEMAQGMYAIFTSGIHVTDIDLMRSVAPGVHPTAQFRKYVSQILSSTRLPSSTIMLGLFYLASRMKKVSARGEDTKSSGTVYRMLTTCLLLGSKFLDDNTFQNRSWAEVSSIPVQDLNTMELQWLEGFNWTIHGPMYDQEEGFFMWVDHWHAYEKKAEVAKAKEVQKLTPIDTNVRHAQPYQQQPLMSPEGPIPPQYQRASQYDTQWVRPFISEYSPPTAPNSGPPTPDYYANGTWTYAQAPPPYSRQAWSQSTAPTYSSQRSQPPSYHHTPSYAPQYSHANWGSNHGSTCGCTLCARPSDHFFNHGAYGVQPVAG
jgi:Cyclin